MTAMAAPDGHMVAAAEGIATGDLDGYVDASAQMTLAKLSVGIAAKMMRFEDEMHQSTLSLLA